MLRCLLGMELAAYLSGGRARSVTVVGTTPTPLAVFGPEIGSAMRKVCNCRHKRFMFRFCVRPLSSCHLALLFPFIAFFS